MSGSDFSIEVVRGCLDSARSEEILAFWSARRALSDEEAQRRLPEVVCVLRAGGAMVGVSSVYAANLSLIGERRFWIYRSLVEPAVADRSLAMIAATFDALEREFEIAPGAPIGLCLLLADPEERRRQPEAAWPEPPMIYAGYLADGRQVRIAYFEDAEII
jgi:hypothetical protein